MSSFGRFCDRALPWLFYALFFITPLVLWPRTSEVFEFNKMLTVYAITILIVASWLIKSLANKKFVIKRTPLDIPILLFLASQIASTIFSIDVHTSLWGYYSRFHGGLASTICYTLLYYAYISNEVNLKFSTISLLSSATLISLYGVAEHFGIDKHLWVQDVQSRVFSTLGQPNWLSAYLAALLPLPIFLGANSKNIRRSLIYFSLAILYLTTIIFTKSRSGIGTTFIILAITAIIISIQKKSWKYPLLFVSILAIPLIASPKLITDSKNAFIKIVSINQGIDTQKELNRIGGSDSFDIRKIVWQGAIELGKKYPVLGTGVETFAYSYYWVRPMSHNLVSEWEFLYNKAHNEYLNFLATTGFVGLGTYLTFLIWTIVWWIKSSKNFDHKQYDYINIALLLGWSSILITNFFGFSVVIVTVFLYLFPAIIISTLNTPSISIKLPNSNTISIIVVSCFAIFCLSKVANTFSSDVNYNYGKNYLSVGYVPQSLKFLDDAVKASPNEPLYLSQLAEAQSQAAFIIQQQIANLPASTSAQVRQQGEQLRDQMLTNATTNSSKAIKMNRYNHNLFKMKAKTELVISSIKPEYIQNGLQTLLELSAIAPTDPKIIYNIALVYQNMNQIEPAKQALQKAIDLKPDYTAAKELLGRLNSPTK